jgi:glc operon protein GlcG
MTQVSTGEKTMKAWFLLTALLSVAAVSVLAADGSPAVTYVNHEKVSTALAKGGPLVNAPNLLVSGSHRNGPGQVEVHDKETDVLYVVDGEATFVTGGTMVGGKVTKPGQHIGTNIEGGESHHLTKGDVIVIPAGVPHWFKEIPQTISYYVVKVLKQ